MKRNKCNSAQSSLEYLFIFGWSILVTGAIIFALMNLTGNIVGNVVGTEEPVFAPNCETHSFSIGDLVVDNNNMVPSTAYNMNYTWVAQNATVRFGIDGWNNLGYHCIFMDDALISSTTIAPVLEGGANGIETMNMQLIMPGMHVFRAKSGTGSSCPGLDPAGDDYALLDIIIDVNKCN